MHINDVSNSYARNTTFGYKFPRQADLHTYAERILKEQGEVAYNEYISAVKHFTEKCFDATELIDKYLPKIKKYERQSVPSENNPLIEHEFYPFGAFQDLCRTLEFPIIKTQIQKTVVKEISKKQSFIDWLLMREPKTEQITETIERDIEDFDFKNINPELCVMPAQFGPQFFNKIYIFTNDIRSRYEASDRFNNYLKRYHIPVYDSEFEVNPFASTGGIKDMENRVDEYLEKHIESELNKIISEASQNQKKIQQVRYDSEVRDKIRRDLSGM